MNFLQHSVVDGLSAISIVREVTWMAFGQNVYTVTSFVSAMDQALLAQLHEQETSLLRANPTAKLNFLVRLETERENFGGHTTIFKCQ